MEEKLVTLAIHTFEKAQILKTLLESEGIDVFIHNVNQIQPVVSAGVRIRIKESDLPKALRVIETIQFMDENNEMQTIDKTVKKVLIPIDFSDYSIRACNIGFEYAHHIGAEVMLMHAYYATLVPSSFSYISKADNNTDDDSIRLVYNRVQSDIKNMIAMIDGKMASGELPKVKYNYTLREGLPEDEIIAYSKEYRPMIIVMGTRGKSRKNIDLIGSVTAEIIESTKVPLLAIPEDVPFHNLKEIHNVAFATSFNQQDLVAFDRFVELVKGYAPKIHLFNISTSKNEWNEIRLTGTREYLQKHYPEMYIDFTVLDDGDLLLAIEKFVQDKHIDIITLTTYRRSMIMRIFNPSIARKMLFHTNTALLVFPKSQFKPL